MAHHNEARVKDLKQSKELDQKDSLSSGNCATHFPASDQIKGDEGYPLDLSSHEYHRLFEKIWQDATSDNRLSLFGFRRYRTTHLLNLRFLEAEIDELDHALYQAGLSLNQQPVLDRLGLGHAKRDLQQPNIEEIVDQRLVKRLRSLIKEYDEALAAFNRLMTMETYSLADNTIQSMPRTDLHAYEKFKTRMLRVDLPLRKGSRDPIQHYLRKGLRRLWYSWTLSKLRTDDEETIRRSSFSTVTASWERSFQNTARVAETVTRFIIALIAGASLICPLAILSVEQSEQSRLVVIIICVSIFCVIISILSKATNYEAMAASAAYAAVLTVFLSNSPS